MLDFYLKCLLDQLPFNQCLVCRHLKQLGLVGDDSPYLRLTLGLAILAVGGIFAFRFFNSNRFVVGLNPYHTIYVIF